MKRLALALLGSFLIAASLRADAPCASTYDKAKAAIVAARVGRGLEMKLLTKVDDAWRAYRSGKKNAQKDALHDLDVALGLLDKNSTKQLPADIRTTVTDAITAFHHCIETGAVTTASLTVRVTRPSIDTPGATVLVAGAIVRVNGVEVATTATSGQVTVDVPAGETAIEAVVYPMEAAATGVTLAAGTAQTVELRLTDSEPEENTQLGLDEAPDGVLPASFGSFTLRFLDPTGARVALRSIEEVQLRRSDGSGWTYWPEAFRVAVDGSLQPADLANWRTVLTNQSGRLELGVSAIDTRGRVHQGTFIFYLGSVAVEGHLVAPPSNPALPIGGIPVFASILNTDVVFRAVTAADGSFTFPSLPRGNLELDVTTVGADGKTYYGDAVVTLTGDVRIFVNLLYTTDKMNGVPLFRTEPLTRSLSAATDTVSRTTPPERARMGSLGFPVALAPVATAETNSVTVLVSSAGQDVPVTKAARSPSRRARARSFSAIA